eukprot:Skav221800  [mRNA]  locus=scaffold2435:10599:21296:+ [translate_table: standard]
MEVALATGASSYIAMLAIAGFLGATWTASKVSKLLGVSDIVLVITTGVIFGPEHSDCDVDYADLQYKVANGLPLGEHLGKIQHMGLCHPEDYHHGEDSHATGTNHSDGVALMIFESGMHFDFEKAKAIVSLPLLSSVLGTLTPLITGAILTMILGYGFFPEGISAGTALAPTSVGIALRLLGEAGVLQENFGQAFDFVQVVVNPVVGIVLMLVAMASCGLVTPAATVSVSTRVCRNELPQLWPRSQIECGNGDPFSFQLFLSHTNAVNVQTKMWISLFQQRSPVQYAAMAFWPKFINGWLLPKVPVKEGAKAGRAEFAYLIAQMAAAAGMFDFHGLQFYSEFEGLGDREPNPGYGEDEAGHCSRVRFKSNV